MGRQYFDDGSWIETDSSGTTFAANTDGVVVSKVESDGDYYRSPGYWTDARETNKLDAFVPTTDASSGAPWWQRMAEYGITRAIDNHYGGTTTDKTSAPATFAGANGRTYSQVPGSSASGGGSMLLPVLLGVGALFLLG
jgi:hypothetical protein